MRTILPILIVVFLLVGISNAVVTSMNINPTSITSSQTATITGTCSNPAAQCEVIDPSGIVVASQASSVSYTTDIGLQPGMYTYTVEETLGGGSESEQLTVTGGGFVTGFSYFNDWFPVIVAAVLASMAIVAIYYMIGVVLNNRKIKEGALSEFVQAIGTLVIALLILAVLYLINSTAAFTTVLSPVSISTICGQLSQSPLFFTNSQAVSSGSSSGPTGPSPTNTICGSVIPEAAKGTDITANLDYGLAATYVIVANLTNQSITNLNGVYNFESYMGFLSNFQANVGFCTPETCVASDTPRAFWAYLSYKPLAGYAWFRAATIWLESQTDLIFYFFFLQLLFILLTLVTWPFLLAAGIILRSTMFTRRLGGLLMAIALTWLIIYPLIFMFEYVSLNNICAPNSPGCTTGTASAIGATNLPTLVLYEMPTSCDSAIAGSPFGIPPGQPGACASTVEYTPNFYVFPNVNEVVNYYGCYVYGGNLLEQEVAFSWQYLTPAGLVFALSDFGAFKTGVSGLPVGFTCTQGPALNTIFQLINLYGVMTVTGFTLPILNILIILAGIGGLSTLFGGDADILGLGRLL